LAAEIKLKKIIFDVSSHLFLHRQGSVPVNFLITGNDIHLFDKTGRESIKQNTVLTRYKGKLVIKTPFTDIQAFSSNARRQ